MFGFGKPKVSLSAVVQIAEAAGIADFSELLRKAIANRNLTEMEATALARKAETDVKGAWADYEAKMAKIESERDTRLAEANAKSVQALQKNRKVMDLDAALAEFDHAMGKK